MRRRGWLGGLLLAGCGPIPVPGKELPSVRIERGQPFDFQWGRVVPEGPGLLRIVDEVAPGTALLIPVAAALLAAMLLLGLVVFVRSFRRAPGDPLEAVFPGVRWLAGLAVVGSVALLGVLISGSCRTVTLLDVSQQRVTQEKSFWGFRRSTSHSFGDVKELGLAERRVRSATHRKFVMEMRLRSGEERPLLEMAVLRERSAEAEDLQALLGKKTGWPLVREATPRFW